MKWRNRRRREPEPAPVTPLPARIILTPEERRELATRWAVLSCIHCGGLHGGLCNRVRQVELDEQGRVRRVVFWERWEQNSGTIWAEDVWPSRAEMATEIEAQVRERAGQEQIQRQALREADRRRREGQRQPSPAEVAARALGRGS